MASTGTRLGWRSRLVAVGPLALAGGVAGAAQGVAQETASCFGEPATIAGSGTINGTSGDDVIIGSPSNDAINGLGGDDTICGLAGSDQIAGGCSGRGPGTTSSTADSVVLMT